MEIDGTLLIQLAIFLLVLTGLSQLLLSPVLRLLQEREQVTEGMQQEAQQMFAQAQLLRQQVQQTLTTARRKGLHVQRQLVVQGEQLRQEAIDKSRQQSAHKLHEARQQQRQEVAQCHKVLQQRTQQMSQQVVNCLTDVKNMKKQNKQEQQHA
ncbi:MAG: hypothetical protein AAF310_03265 [Myxococcota bacterium]